MSKILETERLLSSIEEINKRYVAVKKVKEDSGVFFNIFDVLGLTSDEVLLHSTFIAALLSPERHGAGHKFLEAFLKIPALRLPDGFLAPEKTHVERELYVGPVTENSGGRIDIFITDDTNCIIIENKIYAGDQKNQMLRYHNFKPQGRLVYLSLFEDGKPSDDSLGGLNIDDIYCISYKYDILNWLNECVKIAANLPYVRETINQYIKTIQLLTNTGMETNSEIKTLLKKKEYLDAAFSVRDNLNDSINELMCDFLANLKAKLIEINSPFTCVTNETNWFQRYVGFDFVHSEWKNVYVKVEFEAIGLKGAILGFVKNDHVKDIRQLSKLNELASSLGFSKSNELWFYGTPNEPFCRDWNNSESMKMLLDDRMLNWFVNTLNNILEKSQGYSL